MLVIKFKGGFANQIFQYAFYLKLKENFPTQELYADISHYKKCRDHGGFKLKRFVKLKYYKNKRKANFLRVDENNYSEFLNYSSNILFDGYWQDKKYFPKELSSIFTIFSQKKLLDKNIQTSKLIKDTNSVSIHVRRGDYINHFLHGNIANKTYYQNSITEICKKIDDPYFFVFSDDLEWCKKELNFFNNNVYYVEGNKDFVEQDMILMSLCKTNIISNSSFSWWASFLNSNLNKIIISPEYWFNQPTESVFELKVDNAIKVPNTPYISKKVEEPFFSIIIPVYNTEKTLRRTLSSVLNQTFENIEIIIVDDCSTDNSYEVLKTYELRDARIKLLHHSINSGSLQTRITGAFCAKGKYIIFLDSDDWLEKKACELLHNKLSKNAVDILEFGYINESSGYKQPMTFNPENRLQALLYKDYPVTLWNKVYSSTIINKAFHSFEPFYATFSEDAFLSIIIATFTNSIDFLNNYIHHYSISTGISTQQKYSEEKIKFIIQDVTNVTNHLVKFINIYKPEYNDGIQNYLTQRLETIVYMINLNDNKVIVAKLLLQLDSIFQTKYFDLYINKITNKLEYYEKISNLSSKKKFIFLIKWCKDKIKNKIKNLISKNK